jgi:hypothetical protein
MHMHVLKLSQFGFKLCTNTCIKKLTFFGHSFVQSIENRLKMMVLEIRLSEHIQRKSEKEDQKVLYIRSYVRNAKIHSPK